MKILYLFGVIGALMLAGVVYWLIDTNRFLDEAMLSQGVVVGLEESWSEDSVSYRPVVVFRTRDGDEVEFVSAMGSNPPSYSQGDQVDVFYLPEQPSEAKINSFFSLWGGPLIVGFVGMVFFLVGAVPLFRRLRRGKKEEWLRERGIQVSARVDEVERRGYTVNNVHPYRILASWENPADNKKHRFKSANVWANPQSHIEGNRVQVYFEEGKPGNYFVDLSFLPDSMLSLK